MDKTTDTMIVRIVTISDNPKVGTAITNEIMAIIPNTNIHTNNSTPTSIIKLFLECSCKLPKYISCFGRFKLLYSGKSFLFFDFLTKY